MKEVFSNISSLSENSEEMEVLEAVDKLFQHNIEPLTHNCEECGKEHKLVMEGRHQLMRPFRKDKPNPLDRISIKLS